MVRSLAKKLAGPTIKINVENVVGPPPDVSEVDCKVVAPNKVEEYVPLDEKIRPSSYGPKSRIVRKNTSPLSASKTRGIPLRVEQSYEYRRFIIEGKRGCPYSPKSVGYYIWNNIEELQKKYKRIPIPYLLEVLISHGVHLYSGGMFRFLTRFRDILEVLGNSFVGALEYDEVECAVSINEKFL